MAEQPRDKEQILALAAALEKDGRHSEALLQAVRYFNLGGDAPAGYDVLCNAVLNGGDSIPARLTGALDLARKDRTAARHPAFPLADHRPLEARRNIIAFTLFGSDPRYLRGALHNAIAAKAHYPGWTCRFFVDSSVDPALLDALHGQGAEIVVDDSGEDHLGMRLARRFLVADDFTVGRFLVRDCDAVVNAREAAAVAAWIGSGKPFHAMRDWWTHNDLMLAGLWGGFATVLPSMAAALAAFRAATPFGPNWDQRFLAFHVWPSARDQILVHDRLFDAHSATRFPTADPVGLMHVGQNEYVADRPGQAAVLAQYADRVPALGLRPKAL